MEQQNDYAGYSFEPEERFEWSMRHRILAIKNSLASLKEDCWSESEITETHNMKNLLETSARILEALELSFEKGFDDDNIGISPKSLEPWD